MDQTNNSAVLDERTPEQRYEREEILVAEPWNALPVRALLLTVPKPAGVEQFCEFIRTALPAEGVNTLVVRFRYQYQFESHPELADTDALSRREVKEIVRACRDAGVKLIPKMNLLGHQSDQEYIMPLLAKYPQFDESPDFNPPIPWVDGGAHDFYCKSLCPLHPDLFKILFPIMDDLIDACEADTFHAGLDEVWIIGYDGCPRCCGKDKAELFAYITNRLRDHLTARGCRMWIWSDRLIDGKTTNLLAWQASMNDTHRAIDLIAKDIVICDWKYEDAAPTPIYFAVKGFDVLPCPCFRADVALAQLEMLYAVRKNADRAYFSPVISSRMLGMFATSWMPSEEFIDAYWDGADSGERSCLAKRTAGAFKTLYAEIRRNAVVWP